MNTRLPLYVTFTKLDLLRGFDVVYEQLDKEAREAVLPRALYVRLEKGAPEAMLQSLIADSPALHRTLDRYVYVLMAQLAQLAPHCTLFNHYGPTETTVGALADAVGLHVLPQAHLAVDQGQTGALALRHLVEPQLHDVAHHLAPRSHLQVGGGGFGLC